MPSIAVMDVNVPHEIFGELTLVFGRDTIDPKIDPANKIYGSDAWTPTFPEIKEVNGEQLIPAKYFDTEPRYRNADQIAEELSYYVSEEVR